MKNQNKTRNQFNRPVILIGASALNHRNRRVETVTKANPKKQREAVGQHYANSSLKVSERADPTAPSPTPTMYIYVLKLKKKAKENVKDQESSGEPQKAKVKGKASKGPNPNVKGKRAKANGREARMTPNGTGIRSGIIKGGAPKVETNNVTKDGTKQTTIGGTNLNRSGKGGN